MAAHTFTKENPPTGEQIAERARAEVDACMHEIRYLCGGAKSADDIAAALAVKVDSSAKSRVSRLVDSIRIADKTLRELSGKSERLPSDAARVLALIG